MTRKALTSPLSRRESGLTSLSLRERAGVRVAAPAAP